MSCSGLKFKGGGSLAKPKKKSGVVSGAEKALGLERPKAFKREHADSADSRLPSGGAGTAAGASASSSAAAASSSGVIYPPVVLAPSASGGANKSVWGLHKNELHEIDANLSALRDADRSIDKMEASSKRGEEHRGDDRMQLGRKEMMLCWCQVNLRRTWSLTDARSGLFSLCAELIEREKRAVEMQVTNFLKSDSGQLQVQFQHAMQTDALSSAAVQWWQQ